MANPFKGLELRLSEKFVWLVWPKDRTSISVYESEAAADAFLQGTHGKWFLRKASVRSSPSYVGRWELLSPGTPIKAGDEVWVARDSKWECMNASVVGQPANARLIIRRKLKI